MGKYDDLIGGGKIILDVEEVLNEESARKVDDRIKKQKAELSEPIEISVDSGKAEKRLLELARAAKQVKTDLQDAISSQKGFDEISKLVGKYEVLKKQVKAIAPEVDKSNSALRESTEIFKETKRIIDQLAVSQDQLTKKTRKARKAASTAGVVGASGVSSNTEDTLSTNETVSVLSAAEKKTKAIQEVVSRISKNSSIAATKSMEDMAHEAVNVTKALAGMYDEGITDTERFITLQYKLKKIFNAMGKSYGGLKSSGAKNSAELFDFVIDGIEQRTGINLFRDSGYSGVMESLFGDSDFSLFNKSLNKLGMKDISELLLSWGKIGDWAPIQAQVTAEIEATSVSQSQLTSTIDETAKAREKEAAAIESVAKAQEKYMYHAGKFRDNGRKAESLGSLYPGRSTGFYGTGTYGVDLSHIAEISDGQYGQRPMSVIDTSLYKLFDATDNNTASALHTFLKELTSKIYGSKGSKKINSLYADFEKLFPSNSIITTYDEFKGIVQQIADYVKANKQGLSAYGFDSAPTMFMKQLGYEGVNTLGTKYADTTYGSIIYDLKEESIVCKEITDEKQKQLLADGKIGEVIALNAASRQQEVLQVKEIASAREREANAVEKTAEARLKLTPKNDGSGAYTALDGKYEVQQDAEGWKVHQRDNAGMWNLIGTYERLEDVRNDASLLAREEIVYTDEIIQEIRVLKEAYSSMDHQIRGNVDIVNKYLEVLREVKSGAMGAADAIAQLNAVTGSIGLAAPTGNTTEEKGYLNAFQARHAALSEFIQINGKLAAQYQGSEEFMQKYSELTESILNGTMSLKQANAELQEFVDIFTGLIPEAADVVKPIGLYGDESLINKIAQFADLSQGELNAAFSGVNLDKLFQMFDIAGAEADNLKQKFVDMLKIGASDSSAIEAVLNSLVDDVIQLGAVIQNTDKIGGIQGTILESWAQAFNALELYRDQQRRQIEATKEENRLLEEQAQIPQKSMAAIEAQTKAEESATEATRKTADEKERQAVAAEKAANALNSAGVVNVSAEELIARDVNKALGQLRSANNNETTLFNLKGVFEGEDLVTQAQEMVENIAKESNLSLGKFNVKDDIIKVQLYNKELQVTVDQMYRLRAATEGAESAQLELMSQSFNQNVKALNENNFDVEGTQQRALAAVEKVRSSLHGLQYDLTDLTNVAKSISSQDDFTKFNNQLKATQDNIQAIKNSTVSKSSMNPLANMQRDMQNANIEIETMRLKLEKFGDIQGVAEAKQMLTEMTEAVKQYNSATNAQEQQSAYNQYSNVRSSFKAQTEYIKAAQDAYKSQAENTKQTDPIREQYQSILDLVNNINAKSSEIAKYQAKDNGSGIFASYIQQLQAEKSTLVSELKGITDEINNTLSSGFVQGKEISVPFASILDGSGAISSFLNDTRTQASLTTEEIDKLVASLQKSQSIDVQAAAKVAEQFKTVEETRQRLSNLTGLDKNNSNYQAVGNMFGQIMQYKEQLSSDPMSWTPEESTYLQTLIDQFTKYGNALADIAEKESRYFAGKQKYTHELTASNISQDAAKEAEKLNDVKKQLEDAAKTFAKESGTGDAFMTGFTQSASGISQLDFSVFDAATGSLRNFRMEMGSVTEGMYVTETTVSKSLANIKSAQNQLQSTGNLLGRLDTSGVNISEGGAPAQVARLLEMYRQLSAELSKGDNADQNKIVKLTKDLQLASGETEKLYKQMLQMDSAIASGQVKKLGVGDLNGDVYSQLISKAQELASTSQGAALQIGAFDQKTNTLNASLVHANGAVENFKVQMNALNGQMTAQQSGVTRLTTTWDRFKSVVMHAGKRLLTAIVGYNVFFKAISAVRKGIGYVKEIDLALTELRKVTDETEESYRKFLNTAGETAAKVGSTISDFTQATSEFARLGYTMQESSQMAEAAIVYKNVGEGIDSVSTSAKSIISTMKAFGIESENTINIVDKFNEVGNNFAISSGGIGEALQRSAAALQAGGNTIDESIGLVTAANSVIQNPEQVGTALKTLTLRLRGAKVELEEAGEDVDGMAESTSQLQAKLKALTHGKVDIMLDADTFKSTTQILREMSEAWKDMTDIERAAALELMGGKRQSNILSSLISNFETVDEVIESSMNSSGSAMHENAKWMDSIAGKSEQLKNSMQELWNKTLNSDVIKYFLDLAMGAVEVVDAVGMLPTVLAAVLIYLKAFKNIGIISVGKDLFAGIKSYAITMQQVQQMSAVGLNTMTMNGNSMLNIQSLNAYAAAISNLSAKQQAAILTSNGLTKAQAAQVMAHNGVEEATIRQILGQEALNAAQTQSTAITVAQAQAKLQEQDVAISATTAKWLEDNATQQLTRDLILSAVASGALKGATDQEIASLLGMASASNTASVGIKGLASAMWSMMASNPVGWIMMAVSAILMLLPALTKLAKRNEEVRREVEELAQTYETAKKSFDDNLKTLTTSSDTNLYKTLEDEFKYLAKGVDKYGNNISLTADQYERYRDICETICDINPSLKSGYDDVTEAIGNNVSLLSQLIELQTTSARQEAADYISDKNLKTIFKDKKNSVKEAVSSFRSYISGGNGIGLSNILYEAFDWNNVGTKDYGDTSTNADDLAKKILETMGVSEVDEALKKYYNDYGYFQFTDFIDEYADLIATSSSLFNKEIIDNWADSYNSSKRELESAQEGMIDTFLQIPLSLEEYSKLSDPSKEFTINWIKNSELFKIDENTSKKEILTLKRTIKDFVRQLANEDYTTVLDDGTSVNATDILDSIYTFDTKEVNWEKYKQEMNSLVDLLWQAIGAEKNTLDIKDQDDLKLTLNLDIQTEKDNESKMIKRYAAIKQTTEEAATAYFNSLPVTVVQRLLKVDWNLVDKNNIDDVINQATKIIIPIKTYSSILEDIDKYNEILGQTVEIVTNDTKVTQEYKDALVELGISEKDLADCFYENNPLVVKNADALNELVKDTKKVVAQNIKLARSQEILKYYEKYKELKQLTNGKKVETAATLNQVKAIYAEMTALQKSISRYSMLEHQLLGATNAYEEFAKAQEIDEENDYESKSEELVGYLVDAFQTAKLGTESAQAAIKGLVPESVYEDFDTLDEKMQAVYDYFTTDLSKYFYVKFNDDGSLESAEMLVDNVKQFVEDGIAKGVFTGSWEEWDLDSSISSLEDLTAKMGVTKEVAYAFLQAMETYNISWIGGDASTLLDKLVPTTAQINTVKEQIQDAFNQTPFDLTARLNVSAEKLAEEGHTSYSSTFDSSEFGLYNEDGSSYQILATPVLPNGDILGPDEMADYINKQLASGKSIEEVDIFVGSYKIKEEAEEAQKILDESIKRYQKIIKNYSLENAIATNTQKRAELEYKISTGQVDADGKTTASEQLKQLEAESDANAQAARESVTAWSEAKKEYDEASGKVSELSKKLAAATDPRAVESYTKDLTKAEGKMWDAYEALTKIGEPKEVVLTVALEQVQQDLEKVKATMNSTELDIVSKLNIDNLEKDAEGNWIIDLAAYSNLDETSKAKVQEYLNYLAEEHEIKILQGEGTVTTLDVLNEIKTILSQTYDLMVETNDAQTKTQSFLDIWNSIKDKAVTLGINFVEGIKSFFTRTPDEGDGASANGTAHVRGTAFAGGSWGAPKTETALTGELGPEILVRNGKWTTVGENGAEFTQVKKGDIIFNHQQSKQLLEHGYVTGRGRAYLGGTAYAGEVHPWLGGMGNIKNDWQNITPTLWNDATNGEYLADSLNDASDAADEFAETLDWIEVRLEEWDETLGKLNAQLENASNYAEKNNKINQMVSVNQGKRSDLLAGAAYYEKYAQKYLNQLSGTYRTYAQNGAIAITDFAGDASEATVEAIQNYRDYIQKAADLNQQAEEILTEIRDLYVQRIDNAEHSGAVRATVEASQTEKLQNAVDFDEDRGLITNPNYYAAMMENSERTIAYLTHARNEMQKEFDKAVRDGQLIVGGDQWYEELDKLYQIDAEIDEANAELEEFQNAINDIYWEAFDELINRFDYISEETQGLIDLMSELDMVSKPDNDDGWNANDVEWTKEGLATLGLHAQELERAEAKAKAYAVAIDELTAEYKAGHYSESEYHEKLNELTQGQYDAIEAAQEEKEAIVELNEARVDAIKEGIEKQVDAYTELIEKKKEELETEKDLYDFQKSVAEQQKDIADIQRKLAALSGDNSASAVAKRKQLEAELIEAQSALEESYYDRSVENQQSALDKELEDFQAEKDAEIEKWEKYLEDVETIVTESLGIVQANATEIGNTLTEKTQEYNLTVSDAVLSPWRDGTLAIDEYTTKFGDSVSSTIAQLEIIRAKWQEVKEELAAANAEADKYYKAGTSKGPSVAEINQENKNYIKATKTPTPAPAKNNNANNNANKSKAAPSVGGTVTVKKTATNFSSKSGNTRMASFVPGGSYTVYQVDGNQILIGRNGVYTGWVNKTDLQGYAKGAISVDEDQFAWLDELGEELQFVPGANGRLEYVKKGTGIVPADLTKRLMDLAMNPQEMLDRNRPQITPSKSVINNNMEINVDASVGTLLHVDHLDGNNPDEVIKIVDKAWDKKMQGLNSAIKKFTR